MFHFVTANSTRATASDNLRMNFLYYRTTMKIMWRSLLAKAGSVLGSRLFLFLLFALLFICPNVLWAQKMPWPWKLAENFRIITENLEDDFMPSIAASPNAASPNLYLVVWTKKTPSGLDIYGARVTTSGSVVVWNEFPICTAPDDQMLPSLLWDGDNFFVVWQDRRSGKRWEIYGARVTPEGEVLDKVGDEVGILIGKGKSSNDQTSPTLAFDGDHYMVVWQGERKNTWSIYFARVTKATGEVSDPIQVDPVRYNGASPAVTFGGENYLVVWQDFRNGEWDIYAARITPSGGILDPEGILISPRFKDNLTGIDKWNPVVSSGPDHFLIVWMVSNDGAIWSLEGKRLEFDGNLVDLIDLQIMNDGINKTFPAVHWDGEAHLLVWEEDPGEGSAISGVSILPAYTPFQMTEAEQISSRAPKDTKSASFPKIAQTEGEAVVVWQEVGPDGYWQIHGRRLEKVPEGYQNGTILE